MTTIFYTDGATKNNGQKGAQESFFCVTDSKGIVLFEKAIGDRTNIETEGEAIAACMDYIKMHSLKKTKILTDSKFWVDTIVKRWTLKAQHLWPLRDRLQEGYWRDMIRVEWVPRDHNLAGHYMDKKYESQWPKPWWYGKKKKPSTQSALF